MAKAFLFPGQGSQFPGMAKDLYETDSTARSLMERANDTLGFRITDIMFGGSEEQLRETAVTQPAVFIHSVCAAKCGGQEPDMVAGHSLGEFSALVCCGALDFEQALRLVAVRAAAMQECCKNVPGSMAAIMGLDGETVQMVCRGVPGTVVAANFNSDAQTVISGETEAVQRACAALKEAGAKRALPLSVSGAFHSPLMEPAREKLAVAIDSASFGRPFCPIYQNANAQAETEPARIKDNLLKQLTSPVLWTGTVRAMRAAGADEFLEFGPGNVLAGLLKRIA